MFYGIALQNGSLNLHRDPSLYGNLKLNVNS